ncbi:MAG: MFS transporter [Ottowia sp.]|uniref:MFS transporter n=1 Tax=Ottowia sp. TaxID=1898956 RepID=UPI0039E58827
MKQGLGRWWGVVTLMMAVVIAYVDRVTVSVLIVDADFLKAFGIEGDRAGQGALMTTFLFGYGIAALVLTPVYERFLGYRRGLLLSVGAWAALTALSPLMGSLFALLVVRALLGASEGPLFSLKTMYVSDWFSPQERGKPNAVSSMGVSLGLAVGFPLVSWLLQHHGWHASFHVLAALNLLFGLPLIHFFVHQHPSRPGASGVKATPRSLAQTVRGALRMPHLGAMLLVEIFTLAYLWGSTSWLPAYLVSDKGLSIRQMGWMSSLPFIVGIAANLLGGVFVDMLPARRVPLIFTVFGLLCAASVACLIQTTTTMETLAFLLAASAFWSLQGAAIPSIVQQLSPAQSVGSAYGIINGVGNMAAAFMPLAMGSMMKQHVAGGFSLLVISQIGAALGGLWITWRWHASRGAGAASPLSAA